MPALRKENAVLVTPGARFSKVPVTSGPGKYIFECFFADSHNDYRHGTWPMFL